MHEPDRQRDNPAAVAADDAYLDLPAFRECAGKCLLGHECFLVSEIVARGSSIASISFEFLHELLECQTRFADPFCGRATGRIRPCRTALASIASALSWTLRGHSYIFTQPIL